MTNWKVILSIAKTHLLTKIKQTSTAALGVTFGIGAYITLVCFMTGLNAMLDNLILNQTPHIHVYNEIEPSEKQPINLFDELLALFAGIRIINIDAKMTQLARQGDNLKKLGSEWSKFGHDISREKKKHTAEVNELVSKVQMKLEFK